MATVGNSDQLTNNQIVRLAATISANNIAAIAEGYMDISSETIKNKKYENKDDAEAFNREIIRYWMNKNPDNQVEKLVCILKQAAQECGYPDLKKVQEVLGITKQESSVGQNSKVTHDSLLKMAEDLRPHTARTMKIEPAPWIRDYVVDMEELYTELTLEKIDKKLFREDRRKLENYKELFALHNPGMLQYFDIRYYCPNLIPKTKILIKGNQGIGKTSLSKKIAWDWAKRLFVKVSIVFFVFLKLVKPNDALEDVIIIQNDKLQSKNVTSKKLTDILERFGHECLLILDGLDECALGQNSDVLKVIKGSKFSDCNILLTSRPLSTREFEIYFDVIISVEGFTRNEARKFALRIVPDQKKVDVILNFNPVGDRDDHSVHFSSDEDEDDFVFDAKPSFNPAGERGNRPVQSVPILLSFLCLLVREENIDLSDKAINMGEIYFRMVRCLYKKFTIRKGIEFETTSFFEVLELLGKLALDTLLSGNTLLQRSQIAAEVGSDAFDYGLLIGHEDAHRLIRDETTDIFITFPHRSLQEFLGAFYFVLSLGQRQTVNHIEKAFQEFLENPLFAEFCLWFLDESNRFFSFPERSVACEQLSSYVAEQIDDVEMDFMKLEENYPALGLALNKKNKMALTILDLAVTKCRKIEHLSIDTRHLNGILRSLQPIVFGRLKSIVQSKVSERTEWSQPRKKDEINLIPEEIPLLFVRWYNVPNFNVEVKLGQLKSGKSWEMLETVLNFAECWRRSVHLNMLWWDLIEPNDVSLLRTQWPSVHTLDCSHNDNGIISDQFFFWMLQQCPQVVKLFLNNCTLESFDLSCLASIALQGRLRKISTLDISNNEDVGGNLEKLLCSSFASLEILLLNSCGLGSNDLSSLARASANGRLPRLSTLDISNNPDIGGNLSTLFCSASMPSLHSLFLSSCELNGLDMSSLAEARKRALLPQLKNLDASFNPHSSSHSKSNSSSEVLYILPGLNTLVVRGCCLEYNDLYHMYQRAVTDCDYFSELTTLDMTLNSGIGGYLSALMCHYFPNLSVLVLRKCILNSYDLLSLAQASSLGRLPELRHLDLSQNDIGRKKRGLVRLFGGLEGFPSLIILMLCDCHLELQHLCSLTQARLDGKLPQIKHLDISLNGLSDHVGILSRDPITQREISWGSVICYDPKEKIPSEYVNLKGKTRKNNRKKKR